MFDTTCNVIDNETTNYIMTTDTNIYISFKNTIKAHDLLVVDLLSWNRYRRSDH